MIFRSLTTDGDWQFGQGINSYLRNEDAINANIKTRLLSWVGDCFFALSDGIDWRNRLDVGQQDALVEEIKSNLLQAYGVMEINDVQAIFDGDTRTVRLLYDIRTIFSPSFRGVIAQGAGAVA